MKKDKRIPNCYGNEPILPEVNKILKERELKIGGYITFNDDITAKIIGMTPGMGVLAKDWVYVNIHTDAEGHGTTHPKWCEAISKKEYKRPKNKVKRELQEWKTKYYKAVTTDFALESRFLEMAFEKLAKTAKIEPRACKYTGECRSANFGLCDGECDYDGAC